MGVITGFIAGENVSPALSPALSPVIFLRMPILLKQPFGTAKVSMRRIISGTAETGLEDEQIISISA